MSLRAASLLSACLVGRAGASSLTVAMTKLRDSGEFDPKEPPSHTTDVKVGVYLEHLLDVSMEDHTFDMDFYFTLEWMDDRNYRRGCRPGWGSHSPNPNPNPNPSPGPSPGRSPPPLAVRSSPTQTSSSPSLTHARRPGRT